MKPRLAVIDLSFSWPPHGGARLDTYEIVKRLQQDFEVCLFCPRYNDFGFQRGDIQGPIDFPFQLIPVDRNTYTPSGLREKFRHAVASFSPDLIFFTDSWHMKPWIFHAFPEYKRVLRFYAYETLCLKNHGLFYFRNKRCRKDYLRFLSDLAVCHFCTVLSTLKHKNSLFFHEYISAKSYRPFLYRRMIRTMLHDADLCLCYNQLIRSRITPWNSNVLIVPSGVDPERFPPSPYPQNRIKNIFMPGRAHDPLKGIQTLIDAGNILRKKRTDFKIMYTSPSPLSDTEDFLYHLPWAHPDELYRYYSQADVCVIPSLWDEPFGIVALEAFSTGRPVIASAVGGLQEIFTHKKEGYIFQPGNSTELANYLNILLDDPQKASAMGENGKALVREKYTWDMIYSRYYQSRFMSLAQPC